MIKSIFRFIIRFILKLIPAAVCLAALVALLPLVPYETTNIGVKDSESFEMSFIMNDIYVDGERFDNYSLEKAVTVTDDGEVLIPVTTEFLYALGIRYREDPERHILAFRREEADRSRLRSDYGRLVNDYFFDKFSAESSDDPDLMIVSCEHFSDVMRVDLRSDKSRRDYFVKEWLAKNLDGFEDLAGPKIRILDYQGEGFLTGSDGTLWFSEKLLKLLGITVWNDKLTGVWISTDPDHHAMAAERAEAVAWKNTIAEWIMKNNRKLSYDEAVYYEYLFRHAATVYGLDELIVIGVARVESNFQADDYYDGALGLMQTLVKYAGNYGYTREMLLDPHHSLHLGCMYLRDRFHLYDNDAVFALTAYNQGVGTVQSGNYSLGYARKVLGYRDTLQNLLDEAGAKI